MIKEAVLITFGCLLGQFAEHAPQTILTMKGTFPLMTRGIPLNGSAPAESQKEVDLTVPEP